MFVFFWVLTVQFWLQPLFETFDYYYFKLNYYYWVSHKSLFTIYLISEHVYNQRIVDSLLKMTNVLIDWLTGDQNWTVFSMTDHRQPARVGYIWFCASYINTHDVSKLCVCQGR